MPFASALNRLPRTAIILIALIAMMLLTRTQLFGDTVSVTIHDASWAVLILGGALLRKSRYFLLFALLALGIDYIVLCAQGSALAACLTPAYPSLVLSWLTLWIAGQWMYREESGAPQLLRCSAILMVGVLLAYLISNLGFYFQSGFYNDWSAERYASMAIGYFGSSLLATYAYTACGLLLFWLTQADVNTSKAASR